MTVCSEEGETESQKYMQAALEDIDRDWSDMYINQGTLNVQAPTRSKGDFFPAAFTGIPVPIGTLISNFSPPQLKE